MTGRAVPQSVAYVWPVVRHTKLAVVLGAHMNAILVEAAVEFMYPQQYLAVVQSDGCWQSCAVVPWMKRVAASMNVTAMMVLDIC
jgi:hypothetical protein